MTDQQNPTGQEPSDTDERVEDLMGALERSLEDARRRRLSRQEARDGVSDE